ncbi:MAG: sigma-54 dependent transcriptional regulator [Candidatus Thiodiazotropha sp. (ex Dulcina madagascariensis)]|nr:sigma-54 dependent transcriptional regulator [Candidatus Thiodiazotropha sp. (ex Dulcina madagascariensis)]
MDTEMLVGCSSVHLSLLDCLSKVAASDAEVLIIGPTGVGKELYAQYIHEKSPRNTGPLVPINCGTLTSDLLSNELFGHTRGAFTGATANRDGLISAAETGTLFLDEVDSIDPASQAKLLRFLQDKKYRRIGETCLHKANVRLIAATNTDLEAAVRDGSFRSDLYFRLRVFPVRIPPLCERPDDTEMLTMHFVRCVAEEYKLEPIRFTKEAIDRLLNYSWPGNIRELLNCIRYLTLLHSNHPIRPDELPLLYWNGEEPDQEERASNVFDMRRPLQEAKRELIAEFERKYLDNALLSANGNISQAARNSGKPRRAFFELLRRHNIDPQQYRA